MQALFLSSNTATGAYGSLNACPDISSSTWDNYLSTVPVTPGWATADSVKGPVTYTSAQFASPFTVNSASGIPDSASPNPGEMYNYIPASGVGKRALCVRVTMPSTTVIPSSVPQVIRLAITALGG